MPVAQLNRSLIEENVHLKAQDAAAKLAYRQQYSEPIANDFFSWVHDQRQRVDLLSSNPLSKGLQGINPYTYLVDVLQRVGLHPASQVEELTPRVWKTKFADNYLTSDLALEGKPVP